MSFPNTVLLSPGEEMRESSTQITPLGTRGVSDDGRIFRYCKAGAALKAGQCVLSAVTTAIQNSPVSSNLTLTSGTTIGTTWTIWPLQNASQCTGVLVTANDYTDGYISIGSSSFTTGTMVGRYYPIKSHTGITAASTSPFNVTLKDGYYPETAMTTADIGFAIIKNIYDDVIPLAQAAAPTGTVIGVSPFAVTSGNFFWVQTWGPCSCLIGVATAINQPVLASATDAACTGLTVATSGASFVAAQTIGTSIAVAIAGGYGFVNLQLNP